MAGTDPATRAWQPPWWPADDRANGWCGPRRFRNDGDREKFRIMPQPVR